MTVRRVPEPDTLVVVPARYGSQRLPGKALEDLGGAPLVVRVLERLRGLEGVRLLAATDDLRIARVVETHGFQAVMTSPACRSGGDRVAEVAASMLEPLVVNVQGDEPFVDVGAVSRLVETLRAHPELPMTTLACTIGSLERWRDPSVVKVVVDAGGNALYFSRAPVPWPRDAGTSIEAGVGSPPPGALQHIGVYGYRRDALLTLAALPEAPLEAIEQLEQLRALTHGMAIRVVTCREGWLGVDTARDLEEARRVWSGSSS